MVDLATTVDAEVGLNGVGQTNSELAACNHDHLPITATSTVHHAEGTITLPTEPELRPKIDIEHVAVADDPRRWPELRKTINLVIISVTAIAPTLGVNIYNRKHDSLGLLIAGLKLFSVSFFTALIALSLSVFIFVQGAAPLLWSAMSEIVGRKPIYIIAMIIYAIGCTVAALARSIGVLITMRLLQAFGASVAFSLGSGTIADMYEPHERGARVGIFYAIPLLGPSLGPMLGGVLVQVWNWRATFWLMVILAGISTLLYIFFFKETFRRDRSAAYQAARRRAFSRAASRAQSVQISRVPSKDPGIVKGGEHVPMHDLEHGSEAIQHYHVEPMNEVKVGLADVNPIPPAVQIMRQRSNATIVLASGALFGYSYGICYTCARTFAAPPYNFDALKVGFVLFSFGVGNVSGSVLGGRWSDAILARLKAKNGGVSKPEMRLQSTTIAMLIVPLATIVYGWTAHFHVNVAAPVVALFVAGFTLMWGYSSTLAYIVDSNPGKASSAVAVNSTFRGLAGVIVAEISAPIQDAIGDGGLYTIWGGILYAVVGIIVYVSKNGAKWREHEEQKKLKRELEKVEKERYATNEPETPNPT